MKAVILAGGYGTRISEESDMKPKPMVCVGGKPIIWHIMKMYSSHGINDFIICVGYKGYLIKEYFANYVLHASDVTFNLRTNTTEIHHHEAEPWRVTISDTGEKTMTGGRIKRVLEYIEDSDFCMTYGDGVADIDISALVDFHRQHDKLATVTAVVPGGRFGVMQIDQGVVTEFSEKPVGSNGIVNGGFFVLSPQVIEYIDDDQSAWEDYPLQALTRANQLAAYEHRGFWQPMDTLRDRRKLESLWCSGHAPWKMW